jgi:hypothetical protein
LPKGKIVVQDARTKMPLPKANVIIQRGDRYPHPTQITNTWRYKTNMNGELSTTSQTTRVWDMPLMMHGVKFYYWRMCVRQEGYKTQVSRWGGEDDVKDTKVADYTVKLNPGQSLPCPMTAQDPSPYSIRDQPIELPQTLKKQAAPVQNLPEKSSNDAQMLER